MNTFLKSTLAAGIIAASAGSAFAGTTFLIVPNGTEGASRVAVESQHVVKEGRATAVKMIKGQKADSRADRFLFQK